MEFDIKTLAESFIEWQEEKDEVFRRVNKKVFISGFCDRLERRGFKETAKELKEKFLN